MRFLVDAQLPPALAQWIGKRGYSASPVRDLGLRDSDDGSIFNLATEQGWILVTKDEDFVVRCLGIAGAPKVVWLRIGNCTNVRLFSVLEPLWGEITKRIQSGEILIEVRERSVG
jgi:predicted nuclease of predicted toxin-antitoxin system